MITPEEVKHLAELSRIEMSDSELEKMTKEIDSILDYVGVISNVSGEVKREIPNLKNVMREDVITHQPDEYTEKLLQNTPQREGRYVKVKKIL